MEEFLKLAVNYGLGIFLAVGIGVAFYLHLRDNFKHSIIREERLMKFMEEHSLITQKMVEEHIKKQDTVASYQRQEHDAIMSGLVLVKDSLSTLSNNLNSVNVALAKRGVEIG